MFAGLSLEQAPPFKVPMLFFLTLPFFGLGIGACMMFYEPMALTDRFGGAAAAVTHMFTLGMAMMAIFGALFQMLPVLAGASFKQSWLMARLVYLPFVLGIVAFCGTLFSGESSFIFTAAASLAVGVTIFIVGVMSKLLATKSDSASVWAMRLGIIFLALTLLLGLLLAVIKGGGFTVAINYQELLFTHIITAAFGVLFMLIIGVAFQVVPMFWVSSAYAPFCKKFIMPLVAVTVVLQHISFFVFDVSLQIVAAPLLSLATAAFAASTFSKLRSRKRKTLEASVLFWYLGAASLFVFSLAFAASLFFEIDVALLAALFGAGFVLSIIYGMLYKIVPFLAWFHLSAKGIWDAPTMLEMLGANAAKTNFALHLLFLAALFISLSGFAALLPLVGALFFASNGVLLFNLLSAFKRHRMTMLQHQIPKNSGG